MTGPCFEVPARSRNDIRLVAQNVRAYIKWNEPKFPIVQMVELVLPDLFEDYSFEVWEENEMGSNHGLTYPASNRLVIRSDVYDGAVEGKGRDRMTIAHELGHFILHREVAFARSAPVADIVTYRNSEWQANCFGGELLMSYRHLDGCRTTIDLVNRFGVSEQAATVQLGVFRNAGYIN